MAQEIIYGFRRLLEDAEREIKTVSAEQAIELAKDPDVVLIDLRESAERAREGRIDGAFSCPRGMLEFWIDPASPYHKPIFAQDKKFLFFCAGGWRSALAAQQAQKMGIRSVAHIRGGLLAWREAGGAVSALSPKEWRR